MILSIEMTIDVILVAHDVFSAFQTSEMLWVVRRSLYAENEIDQHYVSKVYQSVLLVQWEGSNNAYLQIHISDSLTKNHVLSSCKCVELFFLLETKSHTQ